MNSTRYRHRFSGFRLFFFFCQQTVHVVPQISGCTSALSSPALSIEIHFICFVTDMQVALAYYSLELKIPNSFTSLTMHLLQSNARVL